MGTTLEAAGRRAHIQRCEIGIGVEAGSFGPSVLNLTSVAPTEADKLFLGRDEVVSVRCGELEVYSSQSRKCNCRRLVVRER